MLELRLVVVDIVDCDSDLTEADQRSVTFVGGLRKENNVQCIVIDAYFDGNVLKRP